MIFSDSLEGDYQFSYLKNKNKIHNIFCGFKIGITMTVLTEKMLDEILSYLEKSISNLAKEALENLEFEEGFQGAEDFLQNQFDIRLENLLIAKNRARCFYLIFIFFRNFLKNLLLSLNYFVFHS